MAVKTKIITQRINKCGRCEFWNPNRVTGGKGNKNSGVMIVGEVVGRSEIYVPDDEPDKENEVFIGEAGAILNWGLRKVGFMKYGERYEKAYFTNAIKCYPSIDKTLNQIPITAEHKKKCSSFLKKEIKKVKPKFVLVLGSNAYQSISGDHNASILSERGFWRWSEKYNFWYMPTVHPAYVGRNWGETSAFLIDLQKFANAVKTGKVPKQRLGTSYKIIKTMKGAKKLFRKLMKVKRFAWDLETTSLHFWDKNEDIIGASFCYSKGKAFYLPFMDQSELEGKSDIVRKYMWSDKEMKILYKGLKEVMEESPAKKDGQNTKYDINWMYQKGIKVQNVDWDAMQFHHLVDENTPQNLTYLTLYYNLNFPRYEDELKPYIKNVKGDLRYEFIPPKVLGVYACADADAMFRVSSIQRGMASKRQLKLFKRQSQPLSKFLGKLERNGVKIDIGRISELEDKYQKQIDTENKKLCKLIGWKDFNVNSGPQMQKLLFKKGKKSLGLKPIGRKSRAGNYGTGKDVILFLKRNYSNKKKTIKILNYIEQIRKMRKMKSTYLSGFRKQADEFDRLHTSYLSTGTVTGRPSSTSPNLMNIPRDPIFRVLFIAGKGRILLSADYSQIEARLIAWLANEIRQIIKFANPDFDIHTFNSASVRKIKESEVEKEQRDKDKAVTFGMNYGRSNKSIADFYDLDLDFVIEFVNAYFDEFKKIWKWRERQKYLSKKQGYLQNKVGRRRHFTAYEWLYSKEMKDVELSGYSEGHYFFKSMVESHMERQAMNFPIQSYAHDILTRKAKEAEKALKKAKVDAFPVLTVYDCIVYDCSKKHAKKCEKILNEVLPLTKSKVRKKTGKKYSMTFSIDIKVDKRWS